MLAVLRVSPEPVAVVPTSACTTKRATVPVKSACLECKKAKVACSDSHPCARCVRLGRECIASNKRKGRPAKKLENLAYFKKSPEWRVPSISVSTSPEAITVVTPQSPLSSTLLLDVMKISMEGPLGKQIQWMYRGMFGLEPESDSVLIPIFAPELPDPAISLLYLGHACNEYLARKPSATNSMIFAFVNKMSLLQQGQPHQLICSIDTEEELSSFPLTTAPIALPEVLETVSRPMLDAMPCASLYFQFGRDRPPIIMGNPDAADLFGVSVDELERRLQARRTLFLLDIIAIGDWLRASPHYVECLAERKPSVSFNARIMRYNGGIASVSLYIKHTYFPNGMPRSMLVMLVRQDAPAPEQGCATM